MKAAITQLEISLETLVTNEPINRAAGNTEQADLEAVSASEIRLALAVLKAANTGPIWPEPEADDSNEDAVILAAWDTYDDDDASTLFIASLAATMASAQLGREISAEDVIYVLAEHRGVDEAGGEQLEHERQLEGMPAPAADLSNNSIRLWDSGHYNYVIPLNRIKEPADLVSWVHHLCEKNWVTTDHITGVLELTCQVKGWNLHRNI